MGSRDGAWPASARLSPFERLPLLQRGLRILGPRRPIMRRPNALPGLLAIALVPVLAAPARADWPAGGKYVMEAFNSHNHARHVEMFDLPEGGFYIVACGRGGNAGGYS